MKFVDKPLDVSKYLLYLPYIAEQKVCLKARSVGNLVEKIIQHGSVQNLHPDYKKRRWLFIIRAVEGYKKKPTFKKWLSLICYHYDQIPLDAKSKEVYDIVNPIIKTDENV